MKLKIIAYKLTINTKFILAVGRIAIYPCKSVVSCVSFLSVFIPWYFEGWIYQKKTIHLDCLFFCSLSNLDTRQIFACTSINFDDFVLLDKQRHTYHRPCFKTCRLTATARRIATYTGVSFNDFKLNEVWCSYC